MHANTKDTNSIGQSTKLARLDPISPWAAPELLPDLERHRAEARKYLPPTDLEYREAILDGSEPYTRPLSSYVGYAVLAVLVALTVIGMGHLTHEVLFSGGAS